MLQLNYVVVSSKELSNVEKMLLACKGQEFGAILFNGVLKINKDLKKPKKLEKLVRKMFEVDHLLSCEDDALWDMLYEEICTNWSEELWTQLRTARGDTLKAKLEVEAKEAAALWLEQYGNIDYTDSIDELLFDFRSDVIRAIYSVSRDIRMVFNYGFQMGARYGAKECNT